MLTTEQQTIVEHDGGHVLVVAVAGSGKTETLVHRLGHLQRTTKDPRAICTVMFNKDAAVGFRDRFAKAFKAQPPEIRTFNSMGFKILSKFIELGELPSERLEEREGAKMRLVREALGTVWREHNGDSEAPDKALVESFAAFIGLVKSDILTPAETYERANYHSSASCFPDAFAEFERLRKLKQIYFFDDQIWLPVKLLRARPPLQLLFADRLDHLLIDEAQDVSGVQIELVRILAGKRAAVLAAGDDDQSIYSWRGSKPEFMVRDFERYFSPVTKLFLSQTFRYGHTLSLASGHLISNNTVRIPKIVRSHESTPQTRITCIPVTATDSALVDRIKQAIDEDGVDVGQIAILVRFYSMALGLELDLIRQEIPYFVYGRPPLLKIPELSALIGVLKLAGGDFARLSPENQYLAIRSILLKPSLYLNTERLDAIARQACESIDSITDVLRSSITRDMRPAVAEQLGERADLLGIVIAMGHMNSTPSSILDAYLRGTNFEVNVRRQADSPNSADEVMSNVLALVTLANRHSGDLASFLEELDPLCDSGTTPPPTTPHARLMSIHRSKGMEFQLVIVPGLGRGVFPRVDISKEETESERRLAYVALTRAKHHLIVGYPADAAYERFAFADAPQARPGDSTASQFLWEARIPLSQHASAAIARPDAFAAAAVALPDYANAYLRAIGAPDRLAYTVRPKASWAPAAAAPTKDTDPHKGLSPSTRVVVEGIGAGVVETWVTDTVIRVRFDAGSVRMFHAPSGKVRAA